MAASLGEAVLTLSTDSSGMKKGLDSAKDLIETFVTLAAVKQLIALGTEMLNSFAEAQRGFITLTLATGKNADALHRWAGEMQKVTEFSDDQIEHNMALLGTMNLSETKMKDVMTSAMNLSSTLNIGLDQAVLGLAKSIETGSLGMLGRYIPALSSMSKEALLAGAAVQYGLAGKFKDAAVTIGDSVDGIQKRMTHMLDEQKEKIGGEIAATYVAILKFADLIDQVGSVAAKVIGFLVKVLVANQMIIVDFWRFIVDGFKTLGGLLQNLWKDILHPDKWLKDAEDAFIKMANHVKDYALEFKDLFTAQPPQIKKVVVAQNDLGKAIVANTEKMGVFFYRADSGWSQMVNDMTKGSTGIVDGWSKIANEMTKVEKFFLPQSDLRKGMEDTTKEMIEQYRQMLMAAKPTFEEIGDLLARGELNWKSLGMVAVHAIGKIVSALGDQLAAEAAKEIVKALAALASIVGAPLAPGYFAAAAIEFAGAAAAWTAGAALQAASFAQGGDFTVPPGYPNDSYPMRVQSGEHVTVTPAGQGEMIHNTLVLDGTVLADWMTKASRNKRFLTTARSVVP